MDLGPDPTDREDIIQRYGRRLFVLAYHLTGDAIEAEALSQECLVRSLLAPDFPSSDRDAGVYLHRGLISLWRERAELTGRSGGLRVAGGAAGAGGGPREHPGLWRALSRLDPVSRAVLVLRVAEGHEYETIGKVLDMAPDVVYARLLQARSVLQAGERALDASLFETMNLFLDGRLPGEQRGQFERRLQTDALLRDRVEFHRGLTLELHEEAPPLPREFTGRLRERLDRAQETLALVDRAAQEAGWEPAAQPGRSGPRAPEVVRWSRWVAAVAGALVVLIIGVALGLWAAGRRPPANPPGAGSGPPVGSTANPEKTPDEATIEALRSLGYLAPGREKPKVKPGKAVPAPKKPAPTPGPVPARPAGSGPAKPSGKPTPSPSPPAASATASPSPGPSPNPSPSPGQPPTASSPVDASATASPLPSRDPADGASPAPDAPASAAPAAAASPDAGAAPREEPPAGAAREDTPVSWRVIAVAKAIAAGRNQQAIRTQQEWAALFDGTGAPPPEVAFDKEMAVLLRDDPAGDPPVRFVVAAVRKTADALLIECHREPPSPGSVATAGQAVVVPISDLPIRVVVR